MNHIMKRSEINLYLDGLGRTIGGNTSFFDDLPKITHVSKGEARALQEGMLVGIAEATAMLSGTYEPAESKKEEAAIMIAAAIQDLLGLDDD